MCGHVLATTPAIPAPGGVPCIRGTRIPADYPQLEAADLCEALRYAAAALRERELPLRPSA
ncbi:MAG: hypothetical protein GEU97_13775 [Actinophytocola sp.]|nr:hypothetical protein [Actinophytocola sp.]